MEPETNRFIGALDVLVDLSSIFPQAAARHPGSSMKMLLVKQDGTIITGPGTTLSMNVKAPEWAALTSSDSTPQPRVSSRVVDLAGQKELVAFADTGLRSDYRNLAWTVLVAQDARQALAPISGIVRLFFVFTFAGLAGLALLAVYFSLHRTVHYEDLQELLKQRSGSEALGESR